MTTLTNQEYWTEVKDLAKYLVKDALEQCDNDREQAEELLNDSLLHETIDGHQWVIYNAYNLPVIEHSDNEDYYSDNFGAEALQSSLEQGGLTTLHCHIAFWCLYADVQEAIEWPETDDE